MLFGTAVLFDTFCISALVHLLNAFPTGRLESRAERRLVAGYIAGVLQIPLLLVANAKRTAQAETRGCCRQSDVLQALIGGAHRSG